MGSMSDAMRFGPVRQHLNANEAAADEETTRAMQPHHFGEAKESRRVRINESINGVEVSRQEPLDDYSHSHSRRSRRDNHSRHHSDNHYERDRRSSRYYSRSRYSSREYERRETSRERSDSSEDESLYRRSYSRERTSSHRGSRERESLRGRSHSTERRSSRDCSHCQSRRFYEILRDAYDIGPMSYPFHSMVLPSCPRTFLPSYPMMFVPPYPMTFVPSYPMTFVPSMMQPVPGPRGEPPQMYPMHPTQPPSMQPPPMQSPSMQPPPPGSD